MSKISDIIDRIAFVDELSTGTKMREFSHEDDFERHDDHDHHDEFDDLNFDIPKRQAAPEPQQPPKKPYDAEKNAKNLVSLMTGIDGIILSGIYRYKAHKKIGGAKAVQLGQSADAKAKKNVELTPEEKLARDAYLAYEEKISKMINKCMATPEEKKVLIEMATGLMEDVQWEISGGWTFLLMYITNAALRFGIVLSE
jgi:hypothetical protein